MKKYKNIKGKKCEKKSEKNVQNDCLSDEKQKQIHERVKQKCC